MLQAIWSALATVDWSQVADFVILADWAVLRTSKILRATARRWKKFRRKRRRDSR